MSVQTLYIQTVYVAALMPIRTLYKAPPAGTHTHRTVEMDVFVVCTLFLMQQIDLAFPLMRELVPAFTTTARQRTREIKWLYPGRPGHCFCRKKLRCACPAAAEPAVGEDGFCAACLQFATCDCLHTPLQDQLEVMPSVPGEIAVVCEAIVKLRLVNRWAYKMCKANVATHVGVQALVDEYRASAGLLANVHAHELVVGRRVGCCVGECSRCDGSIHVCACSMFACHCAVCLWTRNVMLDPVLPTDLPVPDIDDAYRGDKPQRMSFRTIGAQPPRDKRDDDDMFAEYTRLRHLSFMHHQTLIAGRMLIPAENLERETNGLRVYDASLDSDVSDTDTE